MAGLLMFMCVRRIGLTNRAADASDLGYGSLAELMFASSMSALRSKADILQDGAIGRHWLVADESPGAEERRG